MSASRRNIALVWMCLCLLITSLHLSNPVHGQGDQIDARIAQMSLEHKVGQMFMVNLFGETLTYAGRDILETWQPGAVVLFGSNITTPDRIAGLTNRYQQTIIDAGGVPLFIAVDQEGGVIARLQEGFTTFPVPTLITATNDPDLAFRTGEAMARELRAVGINMNLAPVADLNTNRDNPIIGRRSPGTDPELVGGMLTGLINGMQSTGVLSVVKHFPGHGDTAEDSHTTLPVITHERARLDAVELPPFVASIQADVGAVMVSHIWYTALEPQANMPASLSHNVVSGLLRDELNYDGLIMTDALDMDAIDTAYSPENAAIRAIQAGNDIIAIGANVGEATQARAMQAVVDAVRAGEISEERIDESVRRILSAKVRFGVLDWSPIESVTLDPAQNDDLIRDLFAAGTTIYQDDSRLLPLDDSRDVAIIYPASSPRIRDACQAPNVRWLSVSLRPTESEIASAERLATQVETVIAFTQNADDRAEQVALVEALPPERTVVVALQSVYDLLAFPDVSTYVLTYSPIPPAAEIACEVLFGMIPATGLPAVDLSLFADQN